MWKCHSCMDKSAALFLHTMFSARHRSQKWKLRTLKWTIYCEVHTRIQIFCEMVKKSLMLLSELEQQGVTCCFKQKRRGGGCPYNSCSYIPYMQIINAMHCSGLNFLLITSRMASFQLSPNGWNVLPIVMTTILSTFGRLIMTTVGASPTSWGYVATNNAKSEGFRKFSRRWEYSNNWILHNFIHFGKFPLMAFSGTRRIRANEKIPVSADTSIFSPVAIPAHYIRP